MSTLTTIQSTDLITNSRANLNDNFSALNADKLETSVLDTDTTLAANSDAKVATQKAVKAYIDGVGVATATTTIKGLVEVATQDQTLAGTATGETGASIVVTPETLKGITGPVVQTYLNAASPATWTKPTGLKYVVVEVQAVGGNGGAATNTGGRSGGGGGGGYCRKLILAASLGATETVTIGTGANPSSFGSHCSANNGTVGTNNSPQTPVAGGTATGGDVNINGGASGSQESSTNYGSAGGDSFLGKGGAVQTTQDVVGNNGLGYGGGGSGAIATTTTDFNGGTGAPAIVIVTEYYV